MEKKRLPEDFKEFVKFLNTNEVQYLLVGGWAVGIYGHPRATEDIDFLVAMDEINLVKLRKALLEFGAPPVDIEYFKQKGNVIRMGRSPIQIDIINTATGIDTNECYSRREIVNVDGVDVAIISRQDLIREFNPLTQFI